MRRGAKTYFAVLATVYLLWALYMQSTGSWVLIPKYWEISLTMLFGSFIAGATAEGGGAIAFPVFTKILNIPPAEAAIFGLMIQSVGMVMASLVIFLRRTKVLTRVILWVLLGGLVGQLIGATAFYISPAYSKIIFTTIATAFGVALAVSRWFLNIEPVQEPKEWGQSHSILFTFVGIVGGTVAGITGTGIDMLTFIILTLLFGIDERISTPTTVIIMGFNSIVGFAIHYFILCDIGLVWNYWLVAVPVVVIGAPMGALAVTYARRDWIIVFLLLIIAAELLSTILLVPFNQNMVLTAAGVSLGCFCWFYLMLYFRRNASPHHI